MNTQPSVQFGSAQVGGPRPSGSPLAVTDHAALAPRIRVLVCDDHPIVLSGFSTTFKGYPIDVVGEVSDSAGIVAAVLQHKPDVVLLDIRYAENAPTGLEIAAALQKVAPDVRIVVYSQFDTDSIIQSTYRLGCAAFVTKQTAIPMVVDAIQHAFNGARYFLPEIAERLAVLGLQVDDSPLAKLNVREAEVFRLLAIGQTQEEIAAKMGLGLKTVNTASQAIREKLGIQRTAQLTMLAIKLKIISLE